MTTRKRGGAVLLALGLAGCSTTGPLHVYSLPATGAEAILDLGNHAQAESPSFVGSDEKVLGFAYDPYTDHFFLRLPPGNRFRVVDRPARAIKREFTIEEAEPRSGGDLALRPKDGHLFLIESDAILESNRFGKFVRTFTLAGVAHPPAALAFDMMRDRLIALATDGRRVTLHDLQGAKLEEVTLERAVGSSLAFDAAAREFYAAFRERPTEAGVFSETGKLLRTMNIAGPLVDVGQRSFVRVF